MKIFFRISAVLLLLAAIGTYLWHPFIWSLLIVIPYILLGVFDILQPKRAIRRNFPVIGRLRYLAEGVRPEIRQYFVESDTDGRPFNRLSRNVIYRRAKKVNDTMPFGTQMDVYNVGYEWLNHSITPMDGRNEENDPRVLVGGKDCKQPYSASILNISAMSYGSLSKNAILALNGGAKLGNFAHNTGEGGLSPYHLEPGGDIIWQIGTGYFGCRNRQGGFNEEKFAERAVFPNVKMIEIKLSQGAKPGHGGILPAKKLTPEIAEIRHVEMGKDVISPPGHTAFNTPIEMMHFIKKLRDLSGGKPIGFKLCVGKKSEFIAICKAMIKTSILPDFITVDGGEGGTGAAPPEFSNYVGMPLREALAFVSDTLTGFALKQHIRVIASGRVFSGFDIVKNLSIGADMCNCARGMMFALGCIQALQCNTNTCPTGVATQNPYLVRGLDVNDKRVRVKNFHEETVKSAVELISSAGLTHPKNLNRSLIYRRVSSYQIKTYTEMYPQLVAGSLLQTPYPTEWEQEMKNSHEETFQSILNA